jgi:putative transposase
MREYRRRLPHFHPDGAYLFVTWRLWGSRPRASSSVPVATPGQAFVRDDRLLDRSSSGPLWLREPAIAAFVSQTLAIGDVERHFYELSAWVVMPNHVHLLILAKTGLAVNRPRSIPGHEALEVMSKARFAFIPASG